MYCRYCLQPIPDRSPRCPECGSNLLETVADTGPERGRFSLTPAQTQLAAVLFVIVALAFLCTIIGLARPQMLPGPVIAALNLGTPSPTPTLQIVRGTAIIATPTPMAWVEHVNPDAGFRLSMPNGWQVINQARTGWQNDLRLLTREYSWADSLFEGRLILAEARSRAVEPSLVNSETGQVALLTVSTTTTVGEDLIVAEIEELTQTALPQLIELVAPVQGADFAVQRRERRTVNGRDVLFVDLSGRTTILEQRPFSRIQLHFVFTSQQLYLIGILAEEQVMNSNRVLFDQIVNSFEPLP